MNEWMSKWMDELIDGWIDEYQSDSVSLNEQFNNKESRLNWTYNIIAIIVQYKRRSVCC